MEFRKEAIQRHTT